MSLTALSFAIEVLGQLPQLIVAGVDVLDFVESSNEKIQKMISENREPTDEEWAELNQLIEDLREQRPDVSGE